MATAQRYWITAEDDDRARMEPGDWLSGHMKRLGLSDMDLLRNIQEFGYEGRSRTAVTNWRNKVALIPPETIPKICLALGFSTSLADSVTCEVLKEAYPDLAPFIRDPDKQRRQEFAVYLRGLGAARKRGTEARPEI